MLNIETLRAHGATVDEGLARCMNNEDFYLRLVRRALEDDHYDQLAKALADHDLAAAFEVAHALKGILANLSLTPIQKPVEEVTELLRAREDIDYDPYLQEILKQKETLAALDK